MRPGAMPIRKPHRPAPKGWRCWRPCRRAPSGPQRELTLQLSLGELLIVAKGAPAPEVGEVRQAHHLCQQLGETPQHFQTLQGLQRFHLVQAQLHAAGELAQQLIHLAHRQGEAGLVQEGQAAIGAVAFFRGDLVAARAHLSTVCSAVTPRRPRRPSTVGILILGSHTSAG